MTSICPSSVKPFPAFTVLEERIAEALYFPGLEARALSADQRNAVLAQAEIVRERWCASARSEGRIEGVLDSFNIPLPQETNHFGVYETMDAMK